MYDVIRAEGRTACTMCVISILGCSVCGAESRPDTDLIIPGTSFGPVLRGIVQSYHAVHVVEADIRTLPEDLHDAKFSEGAISNCVSVVAAHLDTPPVCLPLGEPITCMDTSREYLSPIKPPPADTSEYGRQDAALSCRSNTWTSFVSQPQMVQILERASMDPWVATDETTNHISGDDVFTLVSNTVHTTLTRTVPHKTADALCQTHRWMEYRPGMRDGTTGFGWHRARRSRCNVHICRKSEDFAMQNGMGSPEYMRHTMLGEIYHDAKKIIKKIELRAGGPIRCASRLSIIDKIPGLAEYVCNSKAQLTDRINMIIESFPKDGFTTTLLNARDDMFNPLYVPGMALQNNDTERIIRDDVVPDRRRYRFPSKKVAYNHSIIRSFAATCRKNNISPFKASINLGTNRRFDIFNIGIPPPIFAGGAS